MTRTPNSRLLNQPAGSPLLSDRQRVDGRRRNCERLQDTQLEVGCRGCARIARNRQVPLLITPIAKATMPLFLTSYGVLYSPILFLA